MKFLEGIERLLIRIEGGRNNRTSPQPRNRAVGFVETTGEILRESRSNERLMQYDCWWNDEITGR